MENENDFTGQIIAVCVVESVISRRTSIEITVNTNLTMLYTPEPDSSQIKCIYLGNLAGHTLKIAVDVCDGPRRDLETYKGDEACGGQAGS